jgi:hypothetical protein
MTAAIEVLEGRCFDGHGNLKAFAKVKIGCIVIDSCWIVQRPKGPGCPHATAGAPKGGWHRQRLVPGGRDHQPQRPRPAAPRPTPGLGAGAGSVTAPRAADAWAIDLGPIRDHGDEP